MWGAIGIAGHPIGCYWWRCSNSDVSAYLNYIGDVTATPMYLSIDRISLARATKPANFYWFESYFDVSIPKPCNSSD
jgi:hypothetical protein